MCLCTVVMLPIGMHTDFLLIINYSMMDVLVVHVWILYYTHNILLLLTKQNLYVMLTIWLY